MDKKQYKTPTVKVVEFKAELGFAGSAFTLNETGTTFEMDLLSDEEAKNERFERQTWGTF